MSNWDRRYAERVGLPQAASLPAVRRKLENLNARSDEKRQADGRKLEETLAQLRNAATPYRGNI